jgi:hypothetical protein
MISLHVSLSALVAAGCRDWVPRCCLAEQNLKVVEYDVALSVVLVPAGSTLTSPDAFVVQESMRLKADQNEFVSPCKGMMVFVLDNTYSRLRSKTVTCTVEVRGAQSGPCFASCVDLRGGGEDCVCRARACERVSERACARLCVCICACMCVRARVCSGACCCWCVRHPKPVRVCVPT